MNDRAPESDHDYLMCSATDCEAERWQADLAGRAAGYNSRFLRGVPARHKHGRKKALGLDDSGDNK
jgi:hypothetical protein